MVLFLILGVRIVVSNYDLWWITSRIVDPSVEVYYLLDETVKDAWAFRPEDRHILLLNSADMLIHTGTFERNWLPSALFKARNSKIVEEADGHIDLSRYFDVYANSNCYVMTKDSMIRAGKIISGILRKRIKDFPENYYEDLLTSFVMEVESEFQNLEKTLGRLKGEPVAIYSPCAKYLADYLKLNQVIELKKSDNEVMVKSQARNMVDVLRRLGVRYILSNFDIEKPVENTFMAYGFVLVKVPMHFGKENPEIKDISKRVKIVSLAVPAVPIPQPQVPQPPIPQPPIPQPPTTAPQELTPPVLERYGRVIPRYTSVVLRDRPDERAAQAGVLAGGTRVRILERQNEWVRVTDGKQTGWLRISVVELER